MGRKLKEYSIKRNGDSIQAFYLGSYIGSKSVKELCLLILEEQQKSTTGQSAQEYLIKKSPKITPLRTKYEFDAKDEVF